MLQSFSHILFYFLLYSVIGWVCETLFCSILAKGFVKRGFLRGPYCPIYGIGAVLIVALSGPFLPWPPLVFLVSLLSVSLLEYFASWLLETLFQIRWWDYTDQKYHINGRICLSFSLLFGLMGLTLSYLLHPLAGRLAALLPENWLRGLANGLFAVFVLDLISTIARLTGFAQRLQQLQGELQALREYHKELGWYDGRDLEGSLRRLKELHLPELEGSAWIGRLESALEKTRSAVPHLGNYRSVRGGRLSEALSAMQGELRKRKPDNATSLWNGIKRIRSKSAQASRTAAKSLQDNLRFYQLFWSFLFAGVLGYLVETLYCLATLGVLESRQGLLYGPFNQVYGFGVILMILLLRPLAQKSDRWLFLGSALLGGLFEAFCSWVQELVFGSVSWQYSQEHVAVLGGRTSLMYMFFWGILGLFFIKGVYPRLLRLIDRIPRKMGRILAGVLCVLLLGDILLSAAAVIRWSERIGGTAGNSAVGEYLDRHYPDSYLEVVYPNMIWPEP